MRLICPICYQGLTRPHRVRFFVGGGRLLPFPAVIHFCPTAQPDPANDNDGGDAPAPEPTERQTPANVLSLVRQ